MIRLQREAPQTPVKLMKAAPCSDLCWFKVDNEPSQAACADPINARCVHTPERRGSRQLEWGCEGLLITEDVA